MVHRLLVSALVAFSVIALCVGQSVTQIRTYDILSLGAGSGGSPSAAKLSEAGYKVALLELGFHIEETNPGIVKNLDQHKWVSAFPQLETYYFGVPNQVPLSNGTLYTIFPKSNRANMPGGCGRHNGGLARWGVNELYDQWPRGWRSDDLEEYLEETYERMNARVPRRDRALQSKIMDQWRRATNYPVIPDRELFGELKNGIQRTMFTYKSQNDSYFERVSSYDAYVLKCRKPRNLDVHTRMRVDRFLLDYTKGPKPHVQGVLATNLTDGNQYVYYATKGVNSHLGSYENVALFGRSAMGDCGALNQSQVPIPNMDKCIDMPNIGNFLTHHVLAPLVAVNESDAVIAPNSQFTTQVGVGFSTEGKKYPDAFIDIHMETNEVFLPSPPLPRPVAFAILYSLRDWPGTVRVDPTDPYKVIVDFELFKYSWQMPHMIKVVKEYRKLLQATNVYTFELTPGFQYAQNDDEIRDLIIKNIANGEHPIASLAIGRIVDRRLRVPQVTGLRVMDASVLPAGNHANVNMATVAVALKGTDMLIEDLD